MVHPVAPGTMQMVLNVCYSLTPFVCLTVMAELASLVQRLEVAVGRLESMSGPGQSAGGGGNDQVLS